MDTPTPTETDRQSAVPCSALLGVRDELNRRLCKHRHERNWLNDHNHKVEAMVKASIIEEIERAMWLLEALLYECGVPYTYEEAPNKP